MTPLLLVISDRPHVWVGFKAPARNVRRWAGERAADENYPEPNTFTGDPTDPETYRWVAAGEDELSAVVDLQDYKRAQGAIDALRRIRPEAAVLVITADHDLDAADIDVSRKLPWTDALRGDLEGELRKLEALRRLNDLREFAKAEGDVPILLHPDPDPDALASALAVRALLRRQPMQSPIITTGEMTRPENRRMAELLRMRVTVVTKDEVQKLERVVAVDFFPELEGEKKPRLAVIDHHPRDDSKGPEFVDLRPAYGATATMMTEYLRLDDERRIAEPLATALLYGIKTDTDSLGRGSIAADVEAYAFLQSHADLTLLRQLERPSYSVETARLYGGALDNIQSEADVAIAFLGKVRDEDAHVLADIADFCLGLEEITWAIAGALIDEDLVLTIRHLGGEPGAGELAEQLAGENGNGGGHETMARAVLPLEDKWKDVVDDDLKCASKKLRALLCDYLEKLRLSRRSSHPTHQETAPSSTTR